MPALDSGVGEQQIESLDHANDLASEVILNEVSVLGRYLAAQMSSSVLASQLIGKLVQQASKRHHAGAHHVGRCPDKAAQHHLKQQREAPLV